ncbi:MAG: hypothetical protein V8R52_08065 [Coprobacter fastidiosus]
MASSTAALLTTEIQNISISFRIVARCSLYAKKLVSNGDKSVPLSTYNVLRNFGVESGQQHIDYNSDIYFVGMWIIFIAVFLMLNTLLDILIVRIKLFNDMVSPILPVIIVNDFF